MENLTEQDLESIFSGKKKKKKSSITSAIYIVVVIFVIAVSIFAILNFGALKNLITYWYQNEFGINNSSPAAVVTVPTIPNDKSSTKIKVSTIGNNILKIDALNLEAPISWRIENTEATVAKALENGIIQINGTSLPGEKGNVFITGHSSNYAWAKGSYNSIFATLNNLVVGDIVHLKYQDKLYVYKIKDKKIVSADELSIMASSPSPILTLMTCWPIGTAYKRLAIIADQISPDPKNNIDQRTPVKNSSLPKSH